MENQLQSIKGVQNRYNTLIHVYTHMVGEGNRVRIPAWLFSLLASGRAVAKSFSVKGLWAAQRGQELVQLVGEY